MVFGGKKNDDFIAAIVRLGNGEKKYDIFLILNFFFFSYAFSGFVSSLTIDFIFSSFEKIRLDWQLSHSHVCNYKIDYVKK